MVESSPAFQRALKECARWGVPVLFRPKDEVDKLTKYPSPSNSAAIDDAFGVIFWAEEEDRGKLEAAALLHDMCHVVVWRELGIDPDGCEEDLHTLGLEYEASRRCRTAWSAWMHNFQVYGPELGSSQEWSGTSTGERAHYLRRSEKWMADVGLMKDGKPTYRHEYDVIDGRGRQIMTPQIAKKIEARAT